MHSEARRNISLDEQSYFDLRELAEKKGFRTLPAFLRHLIKENSNVFGSVGQDSQTPSPQQSSKEDTSTQQEVRK